jgi:hypothetical protein
MKTRRVNIMSILVINIETKNMYVFEPIFFFNFFIFDELNGNYVYFPIKKYSEKISMKLASCGYKEQTKNYINL